MAGVRRSHIGEIHLNVSILSAVPVRMGRVTTHTADLWHHYGRTRHTTDPPVPDRFFWNWGQDSGPGAEALGDVTGRCVGDLGAGTARHAAHLAVHHQPAHITAVDASPAQHAMASDLYGHLAPRLRLTRCGVLPHLRTSAHTYDVLYSVFGAIDFTEPHELLPAAATALRPGGRLVFSTLAHHLGGAPAHPRRAAHRHECEDTGRRGSTHAPLGAPGARVEATPRRDRVHAVSTEVLHGQPGPRAVDTLLVTAFLMVDQRVV